MKGWVLLKMLLDSCCSRIGAMCAVDQKDYLQVETYKNSELFIDI